MPLEGRGRQMVEQSRETPARTQKRRTGGNETAPHSSESTGGAEAKFVNLYYLMNEELLLRCFRQLSEEKAAGVDKVTKERIRREPGGEQQGIGESTAQDGVSAATSAAGIHPEGWERQTTAIRNSMP